MRDLLGKLRRGEAGAVLHVDGVDVRIGAQRERDVEGVAAVGAARGLIIERVVDAVDLLLDRLRDRGLDHFGVRAWVARGQRDLWRHDIRKLRDRDRRNGDDAGQRDDDGDDEGEPRPVDEDAGKHPFQFPGTTVAATICPGCTFWMPSTMTSSPSLSPLVTTMSRPCSTPAVMRRSSTFFAESTTSTYRPA